MVSRRAFLITGGAAALVVGAGGAVAGYAWFPGEAKAREPWSRAGDSFGDRRLDALAYAILAPNPHNRQPWMFELEGDDTVIVRCDLEKRLPHTDPPDRQITIGFGCMLELLRMAAAEKGDVLEVETFPEGEPYPRLNDGPVARVRFVRSANVERDRLFASVLERRSTKEPFDKNRPVGVADLEAACNAAGAGNRVQSTLEPTRVGRVKEIAWDGWMIEYETERTRRESIELMRIGNRAVAENPDGVDIAGLGMGLMQMAGLVTHKALDTPGSTGYQIGIDMYRAMIETAQGWVWLTAPENTRASQLQAGRDWVRLNLAAQQAGLAIHPMSQVLQEFPEMAGPYAAIHEELGVGAPGVVHMLGRVGYAKFPGPSPRWPLESKLVQTSA